MIKAIAITLLVLLFVFLAFCVAALVAVILAAFGEEINSIGKFEQTNNNNNQK